MKRSDPPESERAPRLLLRTLGELSLRASDAPDDPLLVNAVPLLVPAVLATRLGYSADRDYLADLTWGPGRGPQARRSLRQALTALRRTGLELAPGPPTATLRLDPDVIEVDLWRVERAARRGDHETVIREYRGGFCDSMHRKLTRELQLEVESVQAGIWTRVVESYVAFTDERLEAGAYADALRSAQEFVAADPLSDLARQCLIRTLRAGGESGRALAELESHRRMLGGHGDSLSPAQRHERAGLTAEVHRPPEPTRVVYVYSGDGGRERTVSESRGEAPFDARARQNPAHPRRRLARAAALVALLCGALPSPHQDPGEPDPDGALFRTSVPANRAWSQAGPWVRAGDYLLLRADGLVAFDTDGGTASPDGSNHGLAPPGWVLPGVRSHALICRVGSGPAVLVGESRRWKADASGALSCQMNERNQLDSYPDNSGSWSLVVLRLRTEETVLHVANEGIDGEVRGAGLHASVRAPYLSSPDLAPNGRFLVWSARQEGSRGTVYRRDLSNGETRALTRAGEKAGEPTWSPDGTRLALVIDGDVYTMDAEGGDRVRLTMTPEPESGPEWSPSGDRLAYASSRTGVWRLYVVHADGSDDRELLAAGPHAHSPAWSPDGSFLAFRRQHRRQSDLWIMKAKGASARRLTDTRDSEGNPAWSPDGRLIVHDRVSGGRSHIWVVTADGTASAPIVTGTRPVTEPRFEASPSGRGHPVGPRR